MCLALIDSRRISEGQLIILSNRDEFYGRPTEPLHIWNDRSGIIGGRDLQDGGTWLAFTQGKRFGLLTNHRDPTKRDKNKRSRGLIIPEYLKSGARPSEFVSTLQNTSTQYNPFNLLIGTPSEIYYFSNVSMQSTLLGPGLYGLSNHHLDIDWFKVRRVKRLYAELRIKDREQQIESFFTILGDRLTAEDDELPNTGISLDWERILSSIFISSDLYGTRASTVVVLGPDTAEIEERRFGPNGNAIGSDKLIFTP